MMSEPFLFWSHLFNSEYCNLIEQLGKKLTYSWQRLYEIITLAQEMEGVYV